MDVSKYIECVISIRYPIFATYANSGTIRLSVFNVFIGIKWVYRPILVDIFGLIPGKMTLRGLIIYQYRYRYRYRMLISLNSVNIDYRYEFSPRYRFDTFKAKYRIEISKTSIKVGRRSRLPITALKCRHQITNSNFGKHAGSPDDVRKGRVANHLPRFDTWRPIMGSYSPLVTSPWAHVSFPKFEFDIWPGFLTR